MSDNNRRLYDDNEPQEFEQQHSASLEDLENEDTQLSEADEGALRRQRARDAGRQFRSRMSEFERDENDDDDDENGPLLSSWVKGIIGILVSLSLVAIIIMLFAKVLFLHDPNEEIKTGTVTVASDTGTTLMTTTGVNQQAEARTTKEKLKFNVKGTETGEDGKPVENQTTQKIKCISPVLVHPQPNSSSANLTTVPMNAEVDFIRNDNGWYYIKYNGITGYAWGQFFTAPTVTNTQDGQVGQYGQAAQQ